jgi:uncharacterized paraquat-inducible protein A
MVVDGMTAHYMQCNPARGGCGYEIPVSPSSDSQTVTCPRCEKKFTNVYLGINAPGVPAPECT